MDPIKLFKDWLTEELKLATVRIPTACCLSTNGLDNFPNARFVSFKEIIDNKFIITGPLSSRKGIEIENLNKVALTFWWTETERQVRIQGEAILISDKQAEKYFDERNFESKIVSSICEQGQFLMSLSLLNERFSKMEEEYKGKFIKRPLNWGGYMINSVRIEFMKFKPTRFHERILFQREDEQWIINQLQP
ncbi:MAG TPA: pyridoxal 5'-phosphate synthase [Flavisolibacter sp.]|nr:pyridoxal 5'-phosphate synthase [Flavisolibacter sp.]